MNQEYKKRTVYIIVSVAIIFTISVLLGFFLLGRKERYVSDLPTISDIKEPVETFEEENPPHYMIKAEDGIITMYYVKNGERQKMKSDMFLKDIFPDRDVARLLEGIIAQTGEEAVMVWENFTS